MISCLCDGEIGLMSGDSCGIIMKEGTSDKGVRGEAGGERLID